MISRLSNDLTVEVIHEMIADPWVAETDGLDALFYTLIRYEGEGIDYSVAAIVAWTPATGDAWIVGGINTYDIFVDAPVFGKDGDWDHANSFAPTLVKDQWLLHDRTRSDVALIDISNPDKAEVLWHISATNEAVSDFAFIDNDAVWNGGHHVTMLSNGDLTLF
jgi:hypothetical protein